MPPNLTEDEHPQILALVDEQGSEHLTYADAMLDVDAARRAAEQARKAYEDAASQYAVRLSQIAALLVRAQKPTAALLVFDQDEETVSADTTIEIVSIRDVAGTDLGELEWSANNEVCGLICTAHDSAAGFYPAASQDTYDTESSGGQWQDRNLLELHIDTLRKDHAMPWTRTLTEAERTQLLALVDERGGEHLTYANGDKDYAGFLLTADAIAYKRLGVSIFDLPDACWPDYYEDGMTPDEALRAVLENGV